MSPVVQVDKDEWEAFRSEFSKLTKNYELVLGKLEQAQAQIRMLKEQNEVLGREGHGTVSSVATQSATVPAQSEGEFKQLELDKPNEPEPAVSPKGGFMASVRFQLSRLRTQQRSFAYCRRCGYQIREASRFCSGCGTDFGVFLCPCGRSLSREDTYCDWCGRKVKGS